LSGKLGHCWRLNSLTTFLSNAIGVAAALCSMTSFIPQVAKIVREREASAVSLRMYIVTVTGFALWTAYGVTLKSWPLIASNAISLALSGVILGLKVLYSRRDARDQTGSSIPRESP
jgi:MtN3 and saliva related transmembrane protein